MSQDYVTLVASTLGIVAFGILILKIGKTIKAEELLTVAMWCGAVITGIYMIVSAFRLGRQPGEETNGVYLAIFGVYLALLSIQKVREIFKRLLLKPSNPRVPPSNG